MLFAFLEWLLNTVNLHVYSCGAVFIRNFCSYVNVFYCCHSTDITNYSIDLFAAVEQSEDTHKRCNTMLAAVCSAWVREITSAWSTTCLLIVWGVC